MVFNLIIYWTILAIITPPVIISLLLFLLVVYKIVANFCLRGRILAPMDIIWDLDRNVDPPLGIVTCVAVISGGKLSLLEFKRLFKEKAFHLLDQKLHSLRRRSMFGFQYWQKYQVNLDDHVKGLRNNEVVEEDEMGRILAKLGIQKLPFNNKSQWEFFLGPHLKSKEGKVNQTVICRLHHSLGDGPSIMRMALPAFVSSQDEHLLALSDAKVQKNLQILPAQESFYQNFVDIITACREISSHPPEENTFLNEIPSLDKDMQIAWRCSSEMLQAAKSIRKSTGASFSAALIASFLDALAQFRGYVDASKNVILDFPFQFKYQQKPKLENNFTFNYATFTMPHEGRDTLRYLKAVDQCLQKTKSTAVLKFHGLMLRAIGWLFPRPLASLLNTPRDAQICFSNFPGPEVELSYADLKMHKVVCLQPRIDDRAIGVTICSYKGVLSVGLNVDTAICKGPNDAEEIMQLWEKILYQMAQDSAKNNDT